MEIPKILYDQRAQFNDYGHQGRRHALHYDHAEASFRMLEFGTALWIGIYFSEDLKGHTGGSEGTDALTAC